MVGLINVGIIIGNDSDLPKMKKCFEILVSSAHHTLALTTEWVVVAYSTLPVIVIPIESRLSGGLDSRLSIAQMPTEVPVGTMAVDESSGSTPYYMGCQCSLLKIRKLQKKKRSEYRLETKKKITDRNEKLQAEC